MCHLLPQHVSSQSVLVAVTDGVSTLMVTELTKPLPHYVKFPGGAIEREETVRAAALREATEETGIQFDASSLVFTTQSRLRMTDRGLHREHFLYVFVKGIALQPFITAGITYRNDPTSHDRFEIRCIRNDQLPFVENLHPDHRGRARSLAAFKGWPKS